MSLLLAVIIFTSLLIFVEVIKKIFSLSSEISRKIAHITSAIIIFFLPYFLGRWQIIFLAALFTLLLSLSKWLNILKSIHSVARKTWGEIFLPAGAGIAALLFLPENLPAFQFGILVMGIADGLSGVIGLKNKNHIISFLNNKKTYEGSLIFFLSTFVIYVLYFSPVISLALAGIVIALLLTVLEAILNKGIDNLLIPIVAGCLIVLFF